MPRGSEGGNGVARAAVRVSARDPDFGLAVQLGDGRTGRLPGPVPLPDLVPKDKALAAVLQVVHVTLNSTMFAVVCLHAAAALKHHFVDRDVVLARMLPCRDRRDPPI